MQKNWLQWSGVGLLWAGLLSPNVLAETLSGEVRDANGQPVAGAVVEWVGSNRKTKTDAAGRFSLEDLRGEEVELHIMAPRFVHQQLHVDLDEGPVTIQLRPTRIEVIEVVALPWHASTLESAQPVNVIAGDTLARQQASTLGETLKNEVGVHTSYFGPVASSPVIRGLSGPRVLITQNGLDAGDVSRVGPDHLVTTETSTAEQVEVLRGPATLFYGSGAIGGVVNIVDGRVPTDNELSGQWHLKHDNVADEKLVSGSVTGGAGSWATHADGFWRESNDYRIPVAAEREEHEAGHEQDHADEAFDGRLDNSAYRAKGANIGASYLLDNGFVGVSVGRLERTYGIPGHGHEGEGDVDVYADLEQDRVQLISELSLDHAWFSALNTRLGYTDYRHSEIEEGVPLTTFANTSREVRAELFHHPVAEWRGAWSLQYKHQDFSAEGAEAFTPPSETESLALGWMEERHFGPVQVQLGARVERVELSADQVTVPMEDQPGLLAAYQVKQTFEPFSLSAGAVWDFTEGYNLGLSLSRAQRAPSAAELYSFGPHIGTSSYEIGALYDLHEEADGHFHAEVSPAAVELETSNNIDLTLRKFEGDVGFTLNAFYNQMDDFYYLSATGLEAEDDHADEHDHGEAEPGAEEHEEEEALPVYHYTARDARLYGVEGQLVWQVASPWRLTLMSDYTRATLNGGEAIPRIPPLRLGAQLEYRLNGWRAELGAQHYFDQDRTANLETESDGYTLVDAQLSYDWEWAAQTMTFYVQGNNLTDTEARPHTSFLKDKAPLPARSLAVGLRSRF